MSEEALNGFTPTQTKILAVLSDGHRHARAEIRACLPDELSRNIYIHISNMRKKLRPKGQDIICELWQGTLWYRHIRLISTTTE